MVKLINQLKTKNPPVYALYFHQKNSLFFSFVPISVSEVNQSGLLPAILTVIINKVLGIIVCCNYK